MISRNKCPDWTLIIWDRLHWNAVFDLNGEKSIYPRFTYWEQYHG